MRQRLRRFNDTDFIGMLVDAAAKDISNGYYQVEQTTLEKRSLKRAIYHAKSVPIIAEIKFASPSAGEIRRSTNIRTLARSLERGGAIGLSVLVERKYFNGELKYIPEAKSATGLPILMKDIIIDPIQIEAGHRVGADAILLIFSIFEHKYSDYDLKFMIDTTHRLGMEVVLEVHTKSQFLQAINFNADIVGVNNRDLSTLKTSLSTCEDVLAGTRVKNTVIAESGISTRNEVVRLSKLGYRGFLIGSAIMASADPESELRTFMPLSGQEKLKN